MKAKPGVLDFLNTILTNELTAINQYFIHAEMCRSWGLTKLADKLRELSIDEMKDAQQLVRHILYLEGVPNLQRLGNVRVGENVPEDFRLDVQQETDAVAVYADICTDSRDSMGGTPEQKGVPPDSSPKKIAVACSMAPPNCAVSTAASFS